MIGAYARLGKTWIDIPLERRDCIIVLLRKKVIKQAVGGAGQKSEILAIPNQYKDTLDNLVDSSDLVYPEMFRPNGQKKRNPTPNLGDDTIPLNDKKNIEKDGG